MKNIINGKQIIGTLIISMLIMNPVNIIGEDNNSIFSDDIPEWAEESIEWALEKELINGYEDGTFKGDREISEGEFVAILSKYIGLNTLEIEGAHWSQKYYNKLRRYDLPLKGYKATEEGDKAKDQAMTRGEMAKVIAAKDGFKLNERQSVYFMYENRLSLGLDEEVMTYESYGVDEPVRRQQIPLFFKRIDEIGKTSFLGNYNNKNPEEILGIAGSSYEDIKITEDMFNSLAKEEGLENPILEMDENIKYDDISKKGEFNLDLDMDENGNVKGKKLEELSLEFIKTMNFELREDKGFKYIFKFNIYDKGKVDENIDFEYKIYDIDEKGLFTIYSTVENEILTDNQIRKGKIKAEREMVKLKPDNKEKEIKIKIDFKYLYGKNNSMEEIFISPVYLEYNEEDGGYLRFITADLGETIIKNEIIDNIFEEIEINNQEIMNKFN